MTWGAERVVYTEFLTRINTWVKRDVGNERLGEKSSQIIYDPFVLSAYLFL